MSMQKALRTKEGVTATLHRINSIEISRRNDLVDIWVESYPDAEARQESFGFPVARNVVTVPVGDIPELDRLVAVAYELVQERDVRFKEAEKV